jgi:hypothetical protein
VEQITINGKEIKLMCGYADGFRYIVHDGDEGIIFNDEMACNIEEGNLPDNEGIISLLIQKAIEGINKRWEHSHDLSITIGPFSIHVANKTETKFFTIGKDINETKLAAIRYVIEQKE